MIPYNQKAIFELNVWQRAMEKRPSLINGLAKKLQVKINSWIPEKLHKVITSAIKQMVRGVLFGAGITTSKPVFVENLEVTEAVIMEKIKFYKKTASIEGGITGAGGILTGLADFPILLGIKIKMLFDIATRYGFDTNDYKERIYLLHIFSLAFCSHEHRNKIFLLMKDWENTAATLPADINAFDWRNFQQEYRDYIDLAKMVQLIPVIGAAVGAVVNYRLLKKLGFTAMNAYRMRLVAENRL
ncbi:MAG: EcsC family protein [Ferruginibacter sp.]